MTKTLERIKELEGLFFYGLDDVEARKEWLREIIELEIEIRKDEIGQEWNESRGGC